MVGFLVLLGFFVVIALLLVGGWSTERRRRADDPQPTPAEHAAADAGRVGSVAGTGPHDASGLGTPTLLDGIEHGSGRAGPTH